MRRTSETRFVDQCTYTPVVPTEEDRKRFPELSRKPFQAKAFCPPYLTSVTLVRSS